MAGKRKDVWLCSSGLLIKWRYSYILLISQQFTSGCFYFLVHILGWLILNFARVLSHRPALLYFPGIYTRTRTPRAFPLCMEELEGRPTITGSAFVYSFITANIFFNFTSHFILIRDNSQQTGSS